MPCKLLKKVRISEYQNEAFLKSSCALNVKLPSESLSNLPDSNIPILLNVLILLFLEHTLGQINILSPDFQVLMLVF